MTRQKSWRRLMLAHGSQFVQWLGTSGYRWLCFDRMATTLEQYLLNWSLRTDSPTFKLDAEAFLCQLPRVLSRCDEPIYDDPWTADAYAYIHLLERYRRFWRALELLVDAAALPMREKPIHVLDVGSGPAPALFAVYDFYSGLRTFASEMGIAEFAISALEGHAIESSAAMHHIVHLMSEIGRLAVGTRVPLPDFEGFDPPAARWHVRSKIATYMRDLEDASEAEISRELATHPAEWMDSYRYNVCVFSNFLTQPTQLTQYRNELEQVVRALRPGGIVVIVGGTGKQYPGIFSQLDDLASSLGIKRMTEVPDCVPCDYIGPEAARIKRLYQLIWERLELSGVDLSTARGHLPRDLWDPGAGLSGPQAFGLRVFRKGKWPRQGQEIAG
jgi:hypothetical protein